MLTLLCVLNSGVHRAVKEIVERNLQRRLFLAMIPQIKESATIVSTGSPLPSGYKFTLRRNFSNGMVWFGSQKEPESLAIVRKCHKCQILSESWVGP